MTSIEVDADSASRARNQATKLVTAVSEAELACRMLEAAGNLKRPDGVSADAALNELEREDREAWLRAARAAMTYWRECIKHAQQPN